MLRRDAFVICLSCAEICIFIQLSHNSERGNLHPFCSKLLTNFHRQMRLVPLLGLDDVVAAGVPAAAAVAAGAVDEAVSESSAGNGI